MTELACSQKICTPLAVGTDGKPFFDVMAHGTVLSISDPLGINGETLIGLDRGGRPVPALIASDAKPLNPADCVFCQLLPSPPREKALSRDNLRPFGPRLHKVLFVNSSKHRSCELTRDDIASLYEEFYSIADKYRHDLDGVCYGMNCGEYATTGATQPHLHSQVTGVLKESFNAADRVAEMCQAWHNRYGREYLPDYEQALRREESFRNGSKEHSEVRSNLIVAENELALLYVPVAQRFRCELQIMLKEPQVANILDTTPRTREAIADLEETALRAHRALGMVNFNTTTYGSRFSAPRDRDLRFIVSISPRTAIIALSELLHRYVVDELPWECAYRLRKALS